MSKAIFLPFRLSTGILAGIIGKKIFERVWAMIDDEEPPKAEDRRIGLPKLVLALALEGGLFRVVRGLADHGSRRAFAGLVGTWPGEESRATRDEEDRPFQGSTRG